MKIINLLLITLLLIPTVFALDLKIEDQTQEMPVIIAGLNDSMSFQIEISNLMNQSEKLHLYNTLGFEMSPTSEFTLKSGESINLNITVIPRTDISTRGGYSMTYSVADDKGNSETSRLTFKIIDIEDAFTIGVTNIKRIENKIDLYLKNKEPIDFKNISVDFSSAFFETSEIINIEPGQEKEFTVELNKEDFKKLEAGFYTLFADLTYKGKVGRVQGIINFPEESKIETSTDKYGFIVSTTAITKSNTGNTVQGVQIQISKSILSRLFTTFNKSPDTTERNGAMVIYIWEDTIGPGEIFNIRATTNWLYPILIILLIIAIFYFVKIYTRKDISLKKKVSFIKAKGGEFALKVSIIVQANKYVEKIKITDRLPPLMKIYKKFGTEEPTSYNEEARKINWEFDKLEVGEKRLLSYVIYSKLGVVGRIALPKATAFYEKEGMQKNTTSNKTFFVAEPVRNKDF